MPDDNGSPNVHNKQQPKLSIPEFTAKIREREPSLTPEMVDDETLARPDFSGLDLSNEVRS